MIFQHRFGQILTVICPCLLLTTPASSATFSNLLNPDVEFPNGAVSFADELIEYSPGINGSGEPILPYRGAENALGAPDVDLQSAIDCSADPNQTNCHFVSLGIGGTLTVKFTDNLLVGSGDATPDLWVFYAGPDEATYVDVSADGVTWNSAGLWSSFALGIDIDAFGFGVDDTFAYVRLRDDPTSGNTTGITVGADIDAIGAISTTIVPLPAAAWLFLSGLISLLGYGRFFG